MTELVSPCCGADYTDNEDGLSYCCTATISESGLCYECKDHAEAAEGFVCGYCKEFFEESIEDSPAGTGRMDFWLEDIVDNEQSSRKSATDMSEPVAGI